MEHPKENSTSAYTTYAQADWLYLVNRQESLLFRSISDNCYTKFQPTTGIAWRPTKIIRFKSGELLHSAKELSELTAYFTVNSTTRLTQFKEDLIYHVSQLDHLADKISNTDVSTLSKEEVHTMAVHYFDLALAAHNFLLPLPAAEKVLSQIITKELGSLKHKEKALITLTFPDKPNSHVDEETSFYEMVNAYNHNDPDFKTKCKNHLIRFSWIGARGYNFNNEWTEETLMERVRQFLASKEDPVEKLKELRKVRNERIKESEKLFNDTQLAKVPGLKEIITLAKEFTFLRTWRTDTIYHAGVKVKNLMNRIKEILHISDNDLLHLTYTEIINSLNSGKLAVTKEDIAQRKKDFITLHWKGAEHIITNPSTIAYLAQNILPKEKVTHELTGSAVYPGVVTGKAFVVFQQEDVAKVKKGDILVAVMTFPHFIAAMEKASAFVTDEGGILCHAAIIAREMKKPCVIATKNATKHITSGDTIQVNGTTGVVKILK
ncbi:MAG: hypothetical protein CL685_02545 [Candidatus Magasanikbacteria bacterium]|nr:hypothetical protein [Candidatus Magasanikbacteria bacterium]